MCLLTGFGRTTQARILNALGWWDHVDLTPGPEDVAPDRPHPDLVLTAALSLGVDDVRHITSAAPPPPPSNPTAAPAQPSPSAS